MDQLNDEIYFGASGIAGEVKQGAGKVADDAFGGFGDFLKQTIV